MKLKLYVVAAIIFFISGYLIGAVWSEPERLVPFDTKSEKPTIVIDNDNVAWGIVLPWVLRFLDEQTGWQKVTECYLSGSYTWFPAGFDKSDNLWIFTDNSWSVYYTRWDGETWSEVDTVPGYPCANFNARMTVDSSGDVWVGWVTEWWIRQIVYNRYENGTWGDPVPVTDTLHITDDRALLSMTTDADGRVWFGWVNLWDPEYEDGEVVKAVYYDDGVWSEEFALYVRDYVQDTLFPTGPFLAPDRDGGVWAVWYGHDWGDPHYVKVHYWDGESWSEAETINESGSISGHPRARIAVDNLGYVWVVWRQAHEEGDTNGDIYYSVNTGSGWSEPAPVNEHPAVDDYPDLAVDGEGRVWCVWGSNRGGEAGIWASYTPFTGVEEQPFQSPKTEIISIQPSIMRSRATVSYSVGGKLSSIDDIHVELSVFDVLGRKVRILASNIHTPGYYNVTWNGTDDHGTKLASGIYFIRMYSDQFSTNERVILIK